MKCAEISTNKFCPPFDALRMVVHFNSKFLKKRVGEDVQLISKFSKQGEAGIVCRDLTFEKFEKSMSRNEEDLWHRKN